MGMTDFEKITKGLECAIDPNHNGFNDCLGCEYRKDVDHLQYVCDGDRCIEDALSLLKSQREYILGHYANGYEYKPVINAFWVDEPDRIYHWHCSNCGKVQGITSIDMKYCPECGARMAEHPLV